MITANPIDSVNVRAIERPSDDKHKALDPVMRRRTMTLVNNDAVRICFSRDGSTKKQTSRILACLFLMPSKLLSIL